MFMYQLLLQIKCCYQKSLLLSAEVDTSIFFVSDAKVKKEMLKNPHLSE
jgi:hypothetical protein